MVEINNKRSTSIFSSNQSSPSNVPKRESKKRKNVRFEEDDNHFTVATSEYLEMENKPWEYLDKVFNLASPSERREGDDSELLELCKFFNEGEQEGTLDEDSDDSIPYDLFAEQGTRLRRQSASTSATVSSLRLASMMRLESKTRIVATASEVVLAVCSSDQEDLEQAFQGSLPCSNAPDAGRSSRSPVSDVEQELGSLNDSNYWDLVNHVQF